MPQGGNPLSRAVLIRASHSVVSTFAEANPKSMGGVEKVITSRR